VHSRTGALAIHDTQRKLEFPLYTYMGGNSHRQRHDHPWRPLDAHHLANWLNERAAGYPPLLSLEYLPKMKGLS